MLMSATTSKTARITNLDISKIMEGDDLDRLWRIYEKREDLKIKKIGRFECGIE
jgi:hypothetical protein